ncbi:helix-turn-helix transcriptional regulator [Enterococcus faecalis]|uniref:winged helix-turn-helix transcriptional regulator n=1 Tax=Enterococcus faecalis TaxID=1351 RepID=UPI00163BE293|nr:helix-turn-helix domain-containing protein [Enterococcus faecalis]EGO5829292.1 helix-turn-helix transcriptional regulator [Enterococcus faecalis]EGO6035925.1 helix-turn-helix transcriptional regulator [Enterococcus faecalis]EHU9648970.1 helix-turn-helix transcriptional regulator [Enterococcus faecalis]EHU9675796.1 helix-turn-helix transcriptional regulator [Enterococcus faecalis]EIA6406924.1 helix-turn-helix transcriptional regulator [Enterococcus faecalis]
MSQGETMTTDKQTSINLALSTINGKWKLSLMDELFQGTKRNGELMRALDGITQRVLTDRLREMEKDGLVHRESFNELPPRVEYTLTPEGYALYDALSSLCHWGETFAQKKARFNK